MGLRHRLLQRKELLDTGRCLVAASFLGLGVYLLVTTGWGLMRDDESWPAIVFVVVFMLVLSSILASGLFLLRRMYHPLAVLWTFVAAVVLWGAIFDLPEHLGFERPKGIVDNDHFEWIGLAHAAWFLLSIFIARWFFHAVLLVVEDHLPASRSAKTNSR